MAEDLELNKAFFNESLEILERLEGDIDRMESRPEDLEVINAVFRGLHTIKGNSSFLGLDNITKISHQAETLLDKTRKREIPVSAGLLQIVRRVFSDLRQMIGEQDLGLDISVPLAVMQDFLAGKADSLARLEKAAPAAANSTKKVQTGNFVRIDETKISKIITLASELELMRYAFELVPEKLDLLGATASDLRFEVDLQVSKLSRLTRSLSSLVFGVRLVPVNQVFQRFPRVVAELAQKLGKEIQLQVVNGSAELDKSIVEAIADPMTHLIRNSADHGIEPAAERTRVGKPAHGTVKLDSYVRGIFVYIEISDDGRGIDGDKILQKAVEKGIVPADRAHTFTENQKLGLIFAPGFSTAEKVTDISGRGVGMDVVKSNINRLKGTVIISSEVGRGTRIQLRFPISMMVLFSLFVDISGSNCAIPMSQIDESMDYAASELLERIPEGEDPMGFLKVHSLRQLLWGTRPDWRERKTFHTIRFKETNGEQHAFIVDDFLSIEEAIVQSVDSYVSAVGLQGATVRKDGSVALVLNSENVVKLAQEAPVFAFVKKRELISVNQAEANLADFLGMSGEKLA
jgi:two-component system, chemotaxis family, sensor kinase CheA